MAFKVFLLFCVAVLAQNSFPYVSANSIGLSNGIGSNILLLDSTGLINEGLNVGLDNGICKKLFNNPYVKSLENSFANNAALVSEAVEGTTAVEGITAVGSNVVSSVTDANNIRCKKHAEPHKKEKESENHSNVQVIEGDGHVIVVDKDEHNNNNVVIVSNGPGSVSVVGTGGNKNYKYSSSTFSSVHPHGVTNTAFVGHSAGHGAGGSIIGVSGNGVSVATGTGSIASAGGNHFASGHPLAFQSTASKVFNDAHSMLRLVTSAANTIFPPGYYRGGHV